MKAYITTWELANELGLTHRHIRRLCYNKIIPAHKVGRDWVIFRSELTAIERHARGRPKEKPSRGSLEG